MKSFMKIATICLPLLSVTPSFAQVSWGVDLRFGSPPPRREIIVDRPYPDAIWVPGYYNHYGYGYRWFPGYWRRPERFHEGWGFRGHRDWDRERHDGDRHDGDRREFDRGEHRDGGRFDHREGRIR